MQIDSKFIHVLMQMVFKISEIILPCTYIHYVVVLILCHSSFSLNFQVTTYSD